MKIIFDKKGLPFFGIGKVIMKITGNPDMPAAVPPVLENNIVTSSAGNFNYLSWGASDNLPVELDALIEGNSTLNRAIKRVCEIAAGSSLIPVRVKGFDNAGKEILEYINDTELITLLNKYWINDYVFEALRDRMKFGNAFVQFRPNLAGDKIVKLTMGNAKFCRLETPDNLGISRNLIYSAKFPTADDTAKKYPLLSKNDPEEDLTILREAGQLKQPIFFQMKDKFSNQPHYANANWYSALSWINISNKIPKMMDAGIDNILNITTHIEIPYQYFEHKYPANNYTDENERMAEIERDLDLLEKDFTTAENAKKTLITFFGKNEGSPDDDRWKINIYQPKGDSNTIMNATAADSYICIAVGINPDSIGMMFGNSKGGSMQRELFLLDEILSAQLRKEILTPVKLFLLFNFGEKYADVELRFKQNFLTTLDTGKNTGTTLN